MKTLKPLAYQSSEIKLIYEIPAGGGNTTEIHEMKNGKFELYDCNDSGDFYYGEYETFIEAKKISETWS